MATTRGTKQRVAAKLIKEKLHIDFDPFELNLDQMWATGVHLMQRQDLTHIEKSFVCLAYLSFIAIAKGDFVKKKEGKNTDGH